MMKVFLIHYPDKFEAEEAHALAEAAEYKVAAVRVSAKTGAGVPELLHRISSRLGGPERVQPEMPGR